MSNKGISVISLVMTIVVIIIIASVTVYNGLNMIEESRSRALKDTMQAISEMSTIIWKNANGDASKLIGTRLGEDPDIYFLTPENLAEMNLPNITKSFTVNYRTSQVTYLDEKTGQSIYYPSQIESPPVTSIYSTKIEFDVEKGVNRPQIPIGMTPIKYVLDNDVYISSVVNNPYTEDWYDYSINEKRWANAIDEAGTIWVWIPRYAYKIQKYYEYTNYDTPSSAISIVFLRGDTYNTKNNEILPDDYIVHPAFIFGNKDLAGIWVMKNSYSFQGASVDSIFEEILNYPINKADSGLISDQVDTHLMKNVEYGAVTYLTHSIGSMNSNNTTGNSYGIAIYPLSIVAAYLNDNSEGVLTSNGLSLINADNKYKDIYVKSETKSTYIANSLSVGDAFVETSSSNGQSWNKFECEMPDANNPFISRGNISEWNDTNNDWNGYRMFEYSNCDGEFSDTGPVFGSNIAGCVLVIENE